MSNDTIRIPISATYRIIDGKPVMIDADWRDVSADAVARFLLEKFGVDAIFQGEAVGT